MNGNYEVKFKNLHTGKIKKDTITHIMYLALKRSVKHGNVEILSSEKIN